jgi:hypothetical protein
MVNDTNFWIYSLHFDPLKVPNLPKFKQTDRLFGLHSGLTQRQQQSYSSNYPPPPPRLWVQKLKDDFCCVVVCEE